MTDDSPHPELPNPLPNDRTPGGWEAKSPSAGDYSYLNPDSKIYVYVYSDAGLGERAWGVNLERMRDNPSHPDAGGDGEQQIAATSVRHDGTAGEAEPEASLHAVALGYMELAEELDVGLV